MLNIAARKNRLSRLFKTANIDNKNFDGEDVYDYSQFIKDNFYDPDRHPDLKIEIQD